MQRKPGYGADNEDVTDKTGGSQFCRAGQVICFRNVGGCGQDNTGQQRNEGDLSHTG